MMNKFKIGDRVLINITEYNGVLNPFVYNNKFGIVVNISKDSICIKFNKDDFKDAILLNYWFDNDNVETLEFDIKNIEKNLTILENKLKQNDNHRV